MRRGRIASLVPRRCGRGRRGKDGGRPVADPDPLGVAGEGVVGEEQLRDPVAHSPQVRHLGRDRRSRAWTSSVKQRTTRGRRRPPRRLGGHRRAAGAHRSEVDTTLSTCNPCSLVDQTHTIWMDHVALTNDTPCAAALCKHSLFCNGVSHRCRWRKVGEIFAIS